MYNKELKKERRGIEYISGADEYTGPPHETRTTILYIGHRKKKGSRCAHQIIPIGGVLV